MGFRAATMAAIATLGTTAAFGMGGAGVSRRTVRPAASSASRALSSAGGDGAAERAMILRPIGSAASRASIASRGRVHRGGGRRGELTITAVTGPRETRIASILTTLPTRIELYFRVRKGRRTLWKAISAFAGFYTANVISLTFGVLGINDVVAGAFCVGFFELVTRAYYNKIKPGKYWGFLNWFKLGLIYALVTDAFKLGS